MPSFNGRGVTKRDEGEKRAIACKAAVDALGRRLRARDPVDQGGLGKGSGDDDFETNGLSDCIGVAITIDLPEDTEGNDRWLLHYEAEEGDKLEEMKGEVEEAKEKGGTNIQVQVIHTDPETQSPGNRESLKGDIKTVMDTVTGLTGSTPQPLVHPLNEGYSLSIGGDKKIGYENEGPWMSEKWKELYDREMRGETVTDEEWEPVWDEYA